MDPLAKALGAISRGGVRYLVIGVAGANYYAAPTQSLFATEDVDLFLGGEPEELLAAWNGLEALGWDLSVQGEPLDRPRDLWLARRVAELCATVRATSADGLQIDLSLTMKGFSFEEVWPHRRSFEVEGVAVPVAALEHIVESKRRTGRTKDLLFLAAHDEELARLLGEESEKP